MEDKLSINSELLPFIPTAHATGQKKTFFNGNEATSDLTQFACGKLESGQIIPEHSHPTMEEFF